MILSDYQMLNKDKFLKFIKKERISPLNIEHKMSLS